MAVSENVMDEIFKERAKYLVNVDELLFEGYGEVPGKKIATQSESAQFWKSDSIDLVKKISVVDQIFESKEYQTYIQLTRPEQMLKSKFHNVSKKSIDEELKFKPIGEV
jgi:hypothetical protein